MRRIRSGIVLAVLAVVYNGRARTGAAGTSPYLGINLAAAGFGVIHAWI